MAGLTSTRLIKTVIRRSILMVIFTINVRNTFLKGWADISKRGFSPVFGLGETEKTRPAFAERASLLVVVPAGLEPATHRL